MFVLDVANELASRKIKFALVGGYALAMHGIVRATMDVDLVIGLTKKALAEAEAAMHSLGLTCRIPVSAADLANFRDEYVRERNLKAWSFVDFKDPTRQVDLLIVIGLDDIHVERIKFGGLSLPVASLEDLLRMKLASNRPEDQSDIMAKKAKSRATPPPPVPRSVRPSSKRIEQATQISPMQALQFLEDMRLLHSTKDEPTRAISLRVPENLLRLLKTRAKADGKKYQSLMIELLRNALRP